MFPDQSQAIKVVNNSEAFTLGRAKNYFVLWRLGTLLVLRKYPNNIRTLTSRAGDRGTAREEEKYSATVRCLLPSELRLECGIVFFKDPSAACMSVRHDQPSKRRMESSGTV